MLQTEHCRSSLSVRAAETNEGVGAQRYDVRVDAAGLWSLVERQRRKPSPLSRSVPTATPAPVPKPSNVTKVEWIDDLLHAKRGVLAAAPAVGTAPGGRSRTIALDPAVAGGHAAFWITSFSNALSKHGASRLTATTDSAAHRQAFAFATLETGLPRFVPMGDTYGVGPTDMDALIDPGMRIEFRARPYACEGEVAIYAGEEVQRMACAKELALLCEAAERGVAPCLFAAFYTHDRVDVERWSEYERPHDLVDYELLASRPPTPVASLCVVSQLSTFSLGDLMSEYRCCAVPARKANLRSVIKTVCGPVFDKVKALSEIHEGCGLLKTNLTPTGVAFCPELLPDGDAWRLNGYGYKPVSATHIDGMPKLTDFNSVFTTRIRERHYSAETAHVAHCLILTAFTRAQHGPDTAGILWEHLLDGEDAAGFRAALTKLKGQAANTSSFLAWLASNFELQHVHEFVSDMDKCLRNGVVDEHGAFTCPSDMSVFGKLVSAVTGSSVVDTHIFDPVATGAAEEDHGQAVLMLAMEAVKKQRRERIARPA